MERALLRDIEVAQRLGLSLATVRRWRLRGEGPRAIKIGAAVRYSEADIDGWLANARTLGGGARHAEE